VLCAISRNDGVVFALLTDRSALAEVLKENNNTTENLLWWPVSRETFVPSIGLTFAQRDGLLKLMFATQESEAALRLFPSFSGFAFHDYEGYRVLLTK
jgi:hypothetical protein